MAFIVVNIYYQLPKSGSQNKTAYEDPPDLFSPSPNIEPDHLSKENELCGIAYNSARKYPKLMYFYELQDARFQGKIPDSIWDSKQLV